MKHILVTGGNRGIGREICRQLDAAGYRVLLGSRDLDKGRAAAAGMRSNVRVLQLAVGDEHSMVSVGDRIRDEFGGRLDVLINNAAVMPASDGIADVDMGEVHRAFESNYFGPWLLIQSLLPYLKRSDSPRIVNMSSGMGAHDDLRGGGYAAYRQTKAALNDLPIQLAAEQPDMSINAVCPGWVQTDMGGSGASRPVSKGAETPVWLATASDVPTGKFLRDKSVISW